MFKYTVGNPEEENTEHIPLQKQTHQYKKQNAEKQRKLHACKM